MSNHKLFLRTFRGEIPKNGGKTPRRFDEVVSVLRDGDTFKISETQIILIPSFRENCQLPQWGFLVDNSQEEQRSFPILAQELFLCDDHLSIDRSMIEDKLLRELQTKFPKTFNR
jgi:hypothetical protein